MALVVFDDTLLVKDAADERLRRCQRARFLTLSDAGTLKKMSLFS